MKRRIEGNLTDRRSFLQRASFGAAAFLLHFSAACRNSQNDTVRFGLISDVHQDIMHDSIYRVGEFVTAMNAANVDFICELGDFCQPHERNAAFIDTWRVFKGDRHHALGNHDMDGGFTRDQTVNFYGMPNRFYSFDRKGVHFICLDGNDPGGTSQGYKRYIAREQAEWLAEDIAATGLPCVLFSHQPLDTPAGLENGGDIRRILESANQNSAQKKVIACFSGHLHKDYARLINGISYIQINSASYVWLPEAYIHKSYSEEIHAAHPWIEHTSPYRDPLWALVTLDLKRGVLEVEGRETEWVGPDPWELGGSKTEFDSAEIGPRISDRHITI